LPIKERRQFKADRNEIEKPIEPRRFHMNVKTGKTLLALLGMLVFAGISLSPTLSQNRQRSLASLSEDKNDRESVERSYSPEGAWFCTGVIPGIPHPVPWMDTYTSDSNRPGVSGTVLCTLNAGKSPSPMGMVSVTSTAHGSWIRTGKNKFAFTAWRIIMDANGTAVGNAKFWGTVTVGAENESSGTLNADYYDSNGVPYHSIRGGTSTGKRIEVEVEERE
jgi:hypothetical protein